MSTTNNKPADTLRDGALKVTIWARFGEKGTFYTAEPSRTYTDDAGKYHNAHSLSGSEILRMAVLLHQAYTRIGELKAQDREQQQAA